MPAPTPSAEFTVNGSEVDGGVAVSASTTVDLALSSTFGVNSVAWRVVGSHSSAATNPTITATGSPVGVVASFPMPSGSGQTYLIEAKINGGKDALGRSVAAYVFRALIGVNDANGNLPFCFGEKLERNATHGYVEKLNELAVGGGGTAATTTYDPTASGLTAVQVQAAIDETIARAYGSGGELTINGSDQITVTARRFFTVDTFGDAASDFLSEILGGFTGQIITISPAADARDLIVGENETNIVLDGNVPMVLSGVDSSLTLRWNGTSWKELGRVIALAMNPQSDTAHTLTLADCARPDGVGFTGGSSAILTIGDTATVGYPREAKIPLHRLGAGSVAVSMTGTDTLNGVTGASVIVLGGSPSSVVLWHRSDGDWFAIGDYV